MPYHRFIRRLALVVIPLVCIPCAIGWWAVRQSQYVPEFYVRATSQSPDRQHLKTPTHRLRIAPLKNASRSSNWSAIFATDEINAWLIDELPKKFPHLLAKGASDPRVVIEQDRVLAAVRYKNDHIDVVISCELAVELTEQPNMLALRVQHLKAGALPIPLRKFRKGISKEAAKGDIDIRWDESESEPVALVTVPSVHPQYAIDPIIVESVSLVDGALVLSGAAGPRALESFQPNGPIYRFVSYRPGRKHNRQASLSGSKRSPSRVR